MGVCGWVVDRGLCEVDGGLRWKETGVACGVWEGVCGWRWWRKGWGWRRKGVIIERKVERKWEGQGWDGYQGGREGKRGGRRRERIRNRVVEEEGDKEEGK